MQTGNCWLSWFQLEATRHFYLQAEREKDVSRQGWVRFATQDREVKSEIQAPGPDTGRVFVNGNAAARARQGFVRGCVYKKKLIGNGKRGDQGRGYHQLEVCDLALKSLVPSLKSPGPKRQQKEALDQ
jgi:hypothetical protein